MFMFYISSFKFQNEQKQSNQSLLRMSVVYFSQVDRRLLNEVSDWKSRHSRTPSPAVRTSTKIVIILIVFIFFCLIMHWLRFLCCAAVV